MKELILLLTNYVLGNNVEFVPCGKRRVPEGPWKVPEAYPEGSPEAFSAMMFFSCQVGPHSGSLRLALDFSKMIGVKIPL